MRIATPIVERVGRCVRRVASAWRVALVVPVAVGGDVPVTARAIAVGPGESLAVSSSIGGDPRYATAVLLPGPIGSAFAMRHVVRALHERGVRTVVLDPLGMGASARPAGADYSLAAQAVRIRAALDTLGITSVVLVGHGTSATIALRVAADEPLRVRGVLSLSGGPIERQQTDGMRSALLFARLLDTPPGRAIARRRTAEQLRRRSADPAWCTDEVVAAYLAPFQRDAAASLRALRAMGAAGEPTPIADLLSRIRAPVRLLVGDRPTEGRPTHAQVGLLLAATRDARVDTVARAGEMLHEEQPQVVAEAIVALARAAGGLRVAGEDLALEGGVARGAIAVGAEQRHRDADRERQRNRDQRRVLEREGRRGPVQEVDLHRR